jgi:LEA14-like dessication related protein
MLSPMKLSRLLTLLGVCLLLFAGCQNRTSKLGEISVTVVDLRPVGSTLLESQAVLTLRFVNENVMPFGFAGTSHKLHLNGSYVGQAVSNEPFGMQPLSTTTREVTLMLENLALVQQVLAMRGQGTVSYRLDSIIFTKEGDDTLKLPTKTQGTLDLQALGAGR